MTSPFGYNVFSKDAALQPHLDKLQPAALLYMNGWTEAANAQRRYPDCRVIHRVFSNLEDVMHRSSGATLLHLQARAKERQHNDVYINLATEPQIPNDDDLKRLNDEQLKAFQWAKSAGVRVAGPHLAHYGIDGARWHLLDPLVNFIADNPDLFLFTCDEYGAGHMFSGVVDPSLPAGSEVGHIPPNTWKRSPVPKYYHVGRITDYFRDRQARGLKLPLTVITEHGVDALNDVTAWRNTLLRTPGYSDIRGWRSLKAQHEAWYSPYGWSAQRAYFEMLVAAWREIYAPWPNVLGALIYCYGTNGDVQWDQFRVDGATEFMTRLESFSIGDVPMTRKPADAGIGVKARLRTASHINLRNTPAANASILAQPANKALLTYYPATKRRVGDYDWFWVELDSDVSGWQALVYQYEYEQYVTPDNVPMTFLIPANYPHVVTGRMNDSRIYGKHEGIDFASKPTAPQPREIVAAADGIVERVGIDPAGYGNYVRVYHGNGWRTYYAHLSKALVVAEQEVKEGAVIGHEGSTGNSTGNHLHFTVVHLGYGLSGYTLPDVVNPEPLLRAAAPPVEPSPDTLTRQEVEAFGHTVIDLGNKLLAFAARMDR